MHCRGYLKQRKKLLILLSFCIFFHRERANLRRYYIPWAVYCGFQSKFFMNVYFEKHFNEPIDDLRQRMNFIPAPKLQGRQKLQRKPNDWSFNLWGNNNKHKITFKPSFLEPTTKLSDTEIYRAEFLAGKWTLLYREVLSFHGVLLSTKIRFTLRVLQCDAPNNVVFTNYPPIRGARTWLTVTPPCKVVRL